MNLLKYTGLTAVLLASIMATGCEKRYTWNPAAPPDPTTDSHVNGKHIVLFAPVTLTNEIDAKQPNTSLDFAYDLAAKIEGAGVSAWVGETLPSSNDPAWPDPENPDGRPLPGGDGAHMVVLCRLLDVYHQKKSDTAGEQKAIATVELISWDSSGKAWVKKETGRANLAVPAKQPLLNPDSKAAWNAFNKAIDAYKLYLDTLGDPVSSIGPDGTPAPPVAQLELVTVLVDSTPPGADIEINGTFRGNTPAKVPMPAREVTLTIKLNGYQTWERRLVPEAGLPIKPTLQPLQK